MATASVLTKKQVKTFRKDFQENGKTHVIIVKVRYDDQCGNGHNTFSITASLYGPDRIPYEETAQTESGKTVWNYAGGCIHDEIVEHFPELAPYIKWHLTSSDGPMHYIANTLYHVLEHGPTHAWVYYTGSIDPLDIGGCGERLLGYLKRSEIEAKEIEGKVGYRVDWNVDTSKTRNLDYARSSAIWPDATDDDLLAPNLKERLEQRHTGLMQEFRQAVESLGFIY